MYEGNKVKRKVQNSKLRQNEMLGGQDRHHMDKKISKAYTRVSNMYKGGK